MNPLRRTLRVLTGGVLAAHLCALPAAATAIGTATATAEAGVAEPGQALRVYLMTMGPGDHVWERFGHNALWIHDPDTGEDTAYNYGVFSFDQPGFLRRFVLGRMLYSMVPEDAERMVRTYAYFNRSVWLQELNLTAQQKLAMKEFLEWNALPANRDYLYDYFRDNCSTRVRDVIDHVLGGELRTSLERVATGATYRSHSLRLTHDDMPVFTGLLLAMGQPVDRPLDAWQESFVPMLLSDHIENVMVRADDGSLQPLVADRTVLFTAERADTPASAPRRTVLFLATGLGIAALIAGLGHAAQRKRTARVAFAIVAVIWSGLVGAFGTIITLLWAATDHAATYANENVLQANPLSLLLAVAIAMAFARARRGRRAAFLLAAAVSTLALLGLALKLLPAFSQANAPILALLIPPHLALAWALYPWRHGRPSAGEDTASTGSGRTEAV